MLQLVALILASLLLLWFFEEKSLSVLGFAPAKMRIKFLLVCFLVSAFCSASTWLLQMIITKEVYTINPHLTISDIAYGTWEQFRSVLTEELLCRGALLYILIKRMGATKAILLSALLFAILHWFNAGVGGNILQMILVFVFTFLMGLLLAYAYAKSFSLLIPFAIHFGWNLVQNFIFPDLPAGNHIFVSETPAPVVTISYFTFFILLFLPKISV